jgi:hypothetical protein
MTNRHTADTINDNDLDALYYRLAGARDAVALHRQGLITTAELYDAVEAEPEATPVPCPACARAEQASLAPTEQHPDCRTQEQP